MLLVYLPTKLGDFVRANVGKYSIHGAYGNTNVPVTSLLGIDLTVMPFNTWQMVKMQMREPDVAGVILLAFPVWWDTVAGSQFVWYCWCRFGSKTSTTILGSYWSPQKIWRFPRQPFWPFWGPLLIMFYMFFVFFFWESHHFRTPEHYPTFSVKEHRSGLRVRSLVKWSILWRFQRVSPAMLGIMIWGCEFGMIWLYNEETVATPVMAVDKIDDLWSRTLFIVSHRCKHIIIYIYTHTIVYLYIYICMIWPCHQLPCQ